MNRAFFIVAVPAILIAAAYLAVYWGKVVPAPLAWTVAAIAVIGAVIKALRKPTEKLRP
jgi:hypothetical protein